MITSDGIRDVDLWTAIQWLREHDIPLDYAIVERYPRYNYASGRYQNDGGVFAYQFMSPAGYNVATYIGCVGTLMTQPGPEGLGRHYGFPIEERQALN